MQNTILYRVCNTITSLQHPKQPAPLQSSLDHLLEVPPHFLSFLAQSQRVVLPPVQKVASFAVLAAALDEVGLALLGFVLEVVLFALPELVDAVGKLAAVVVATVAVIEVVFAELIFKFFIFD